MSIVQRWRPTAADATNRPSNHDIPASMSAEHGTDIRPRPARLPTVYHPQSGPQAHIGRVNPRTRAGDRRYPHWNMARPGSTTSRREGGRSAVPTDRAAPSTDSTDPAYRPAPAVDDDRRTRRHRDRARRRARNTSQPPQKAPAAQQKQPDMPQGTLTPSARACSHPETLAAFEGNQFSD
jgi:hypothetical protein